MKEELKKKYGPVPTDIFVKDGDQEVINGLMFAKFVSAIERDEAIKVIKEAGTNGVWSKLDTPIAVRAVNGFLLGLKWMLVEKWEYEKFEVKVNLDMRMLSIDGEHVVEVQIQENQPKMLWSSEWVNWKELHESEDMKALVARCDDLWSKVKGKGKGKKGRSY